MYHLYLRNYLPKKIFTPTKDKVTLFYTKESPFSNHHPVDFTIKGIKYNCAEQYIMIKKFELFNDDPGDMINWSDPINMKRAAHGTNIKNFDLKLWHEQAPGIVKRALLAKFSQNIHLKNLLLDTGDNKLGESSLDKFWGTGMTFSSPNAFDANKWKTNKMGHILEEVRTELKSL